MLVGNRVSLGSAGGPLCLVGDGPLGVPSRPALLPGFRMVAPLGTGEGGVFGRVDELPPRPPSLRVASPQRTTKKSLVGGDVDAELEGAARRGIAAEKVTHRTLTPLLLARPSFRLSRFLDTPASTSRWPSCSLSSTSSLLEHASFVSNRERGTGHGRHLDLHSLGMREVSFEPDSGHQLSPVMLAVGDCVLRGKHAAPSSRFGGLLPRRTVLRRWR
jgi:hypothetical protein